MIYSPGVPCRYPPLSSVATKSFQSVARPLDTRIERSHPAPDSLCFHVPRRANWGGLLWFVIVWNLFHWFCAFSIVAGWVGWIEEGRALERESKEVAGLVITSILLPLFLLVGLGLIANAIWCRFGTTRLELNPDSIQLYFTLFGRTKTRSVPPSEVRQVALVEFYKRHGQPVNGIRIETDHAALSFGSPLSDDEKSWLCSEIRDFLRGHAYPLTSADQNTARQFDA